MKIKIYLLNAFAKTKHGGNPAGVVLDTNALSTKDMQNIATKINFSETAFLEKSNTYDFKLRFFTPNKEIDLCGHATIATFHLLLDKKIISTGNYSLETKAGVFHIQCFKDKTVYMEQSSPTFFEKLDKKEIATTLNIEPFEISDCLPVQIVSTGIKDILVPIKSLKTLLNIKPKFDKILEISKKYEVIGYHLFTLETIENSTSHCRNFAPLYGILEEAATGTSTGALSCYLYRYNLVEANDNLTFEQGYAMEKPSKISSNFYFNENILKVRVGGKAILLNEDEITI